MSKRQALKVLNLVPMSQREKHGKLSESLQPHPKGWLFKDYEGSKRSNETVSNEPSRGFYMRGAK